MLKVLIYTMWMFIIPIQASLFLLPVTTAGISVFWSVLWIFAVRSILFSCLCSTWAWELHCYAVYVLCILFICTLCWFVRGIDPGVGVLTPWKYVWGVGACFDPCKNVIFFHLKLLLDNSASFTSSRMKDLCQKLEVTLIFRVAYRLSGTGIVECLEIVDVGCNLKQFDGSTWLAMTPYAPVCLLYVVILILHLHGSHNGTFIVTMKSSYICHRTDDSVSNSDINHLIVVVCWWPKLLNEENTWVG